MTTETRLPWHPSPVDLEDHADTRPPPDPFAGLTSHEAADETDPQPATGSTDTPPAALPICRGCGEPIILPPGHRGRKPAYHPEHRPTVAPAGTKRRSSKAEAEAEALAEKLSSAMAKAAIGIATLTKDPYDGFAIMAGRTQVAGQFRGVMLAHDNWRAELLRMGEGASVAGLALALLTIIAPILAHHGIIPQYVGGSPVGKLIESIPQMAVNLEKAAGNAERILNEEMAKREAQAEQVAETAVA